MNTTRRRFLQHLSLLTAAAAAPGAPPASGLAPAHSMAVPAAAPEPLLDTRALARYVDPLPIPDVLQPTGMRPSPIDPSHSIPYFRVTMRQFCARVHRDVPPATFWGYNSACPGPTLVARQGEPILVEWINALPTQHLLPIDHTLHGAAAELPLVRTVVHLHGGRTRPESDGYPEHWFVPGQSATCYYDNQQEATSLFYHDHAMGITRLNAVAGLIGMYLIRDAVEEALPLPAGRYEIPLVLFDRSFHQNGDLYYPVSGKPGAPWVSEYYGSAILVNGKIFPYLAVEPRRYRFRVLNSSNGSYYRLSFASTGEMTAESCDFVQIGSEQGLLAAPATLRTLVLGPGERADLLVDFRGHAGADLYLRTDVSVFLQFRVAAAKAPEEAPLPPTLRPVPRLAESSAVTTRALTLADYQNRLGRSSVMLLNGAHWDMPVTEKPVLDSTEIWSFINLTDDSHPIHLHMVRFQLLDRRPFDLPVFQLTQKIVYTGEPLPTTPGEQGWKDTVRVDPMTVTRIIVRFEGFTGRYVWHCHMLEHEDNDMMRPFQVVA